MRLGKLNQRFDTLQQGEHTSHAKDGIDVKKGMEIVVCNINGCHGLSSYMILSKQGFVLITHLFNGFQHVDAPRLVVSQDLQDLFLYTLCKFLEVGMPLR